MDLKKILKTIKLNEQKISIFLGILILIVAGIFVVRYIKDFKTQTIPTTSSTSTQNSEITKHKVVKGETLWQISEEYYKKGSDWKKIADANNITNPAKLEEGTDLVIPDVTAKENANPTPVETASSTETPSTAQETTNPSPSPQITPEAASTSNEITGDTYTVVKGDSLWKIALRAYGDGNKWVEIAHANNLKNPSLIHSGNEFKIPR